MTGWTRYVAVGLSDLGGAGGVVLLVGSVGLAMVTQAIHPILVVDTCLSRCYVNNSNKETKDEIH